MKYKIIIFILLILSGLSCSYRPGNAVTIRIKGSDTMFYLAKNLAEEYMKRNPGISIYVEGGGTVSGVKALLSGEADIITASRNLKAEEVKELADKYGVIGISFSIAKDALSIYVNQNNSAKDFTLQQIKNIFTCNVTNWNEVGGNDYPIKLIMRSPNSGTYLYFKEHVLGNDEYCNNAIVKSTTESIIEEVANDKNAIGYGGVGYSGRTIHASINGIEPTEENVRNDSYPISRYLYLYTLSSPSGKIREFINWVMSPEGQQIVERSGYISLFEITF